MWESTFGEFLFYGDHDYSHFFNFLEKLGTPNFQELTADPFILRTLQVIPLLEPIPIVKFVKKEIPLELLDIFNAIFRWNPLQRPSSFDLSNHPFFFSDQDFYETGYQSQEI